ncbi:hypothetical protein FKW77_010544 [Venturia effusa]|uniref:Telomeric single stranded DNA binding POT1/Cdc13 domain-containing protein n=1 Tax=Venturia effusa TaxID=50376 RepID=A0A517L0K7_9PEZI|nr:hypothetical protein FKW77_010544 [Venturia effusa]
METIAISRLGRSLLYPETRCIKAMVALIWPYSSSTQSLALLLAEPDFRLRNKKGQVLVRFQGASAAAVARTRVGSGDVVSLSLEGVQWLDADPGITTPGRSVDTELLFKRKLVCQIVRDGQELANLNVDDDTASEQSRSHVPSTPTSPLFAYANLRLSGLHDLSTPASSAFHKRARASGNLLVDSPYDPFVSKEGEPMRKKARHSWGNEARWTFENDVPSPTRSDMSGDWIQDEDLLSPKKASQRITPVRQLHSPTSELSPITARQNRTYTHELRFQYIQDAMTQVSGDTEEDTDIENVQASVVPHQMSRERSYESPLRQSFSVFRDATFAGMNEGIGVPMNFDAVDFSVPLETASSQEAEDSLFNLPSSDSIEALEYAENDTRFGNLDAESLHIQFSRTSSLARELLESDEIDDKEIEGHTHWSAGFKRRSRESEQPRRKDSPEEEFEDVTPESQENGLDIRESDAPMRDDVRLEGFQSYDNSPKDDTERRLQLRAREWVELPVRYYSEPADSIDPALQHYELPRAIMAPPRLPTTQNSNLDLDPVVSMVPPSRPRSPKTPNLRPQLSAALPLPSPFPGDDLATSYMDDGGFNWQTSQGFKAPLRKSLPGLDFGFGFESDGLDRRYSTEVDDLDTDRNTVPPVELRPELTEQRVFEAQLALTRSPEVLETEIAPKEVLKHALPRSKLRKDECPTEPSSVESSSPEPLIGMVTEAVDAQADSFLHHDVVHELFDKSAHTLDAEEQAVPAVEGVGPGSAESNENIADAAMIEDETVGTKMVGLDGMDDDARRSLQAKYAGAPIVGMDSGRASQAIESGGDRSHTLNLRASEALSSDAFLTEQAGSEHAAHEESKEGPRDDEMVHSQSSAMDDSENGQEETMRQQNHDMRDEEENNRDRQRTEQEYDDDDDDENEVEDEEEEGGFPIWPTLRFGPPLLASAGPSNSGREVISLLSDGDEHVTSEEETDLESVDGNQEDARISYTNLIVDEVREDFEEDEEKEDEESEADEESDGDDDNAAESSGSENDDNQDQSSTTLSQGLFSGSYIPSLDGANDPPPLSRFVPESRSELRLSSSMPTSKSSLASSLAPSIVTSTNNHTTSSTAPLPQTRKAVVIELGSDSESEEEIQALHSTAPWPAIKHDTTGRVEVTDTYEPTYVNDRLLEDEASADLVGNHAPAVDEPMEVRPLYSPVNERQHPLPYEQKVPGLPLALVATKQRSAVSFAPRVSRRRALGGSQPITQLEHQSSQPLATSQDAFKRPRLVVQDTFEGMVHSDASVTTAPPSSRGHDSEATTDDESYSPTTQIRVKIEVPPPHSEGRNAQILSSSPLMMSDTYPEVHISHPDACENMRPQRSSWEQESRPQQSMAETALATPEASQLTQSQISLSVQDFENTLPPTLKLTQKTSASSRHTYRLYASQQPSNEKLQDHEKRGRKIKEAMIPSIRDESSAAQLSQIVPEAIATKLDKLKHDDLNEVSLRGLERPGPKIKEASEGSSAKLNTCFSDGKPRHKFQTAWEGSYGTTSKLDPWLSPRKHHPQYQFSSPPPSFEDEPSPASQTLRGDRFDIEGVESDEEDDMLSSQFDPANGRLSMSPTVKHQNLMTRPFKDKLKGEEDDYSSSQLPDFKFSQGQPSQTKGLNTSWGYYTPICNLMTKVSTHASQFFDDLVDVIAVVTKPSTRPLRAESGPKDYVTEFLISDQDFWPHKVSVKIYRPWKPALPVLEDGDAILLRDFSVLPTKKGVGLYMRSNEGSSWCAWKFNPKVKENNLCSDDDTPMWSQKFREGRELTLEDREVCTAAEAQRGDEERKFVQSLRDWWVKTA